MRIRAIAILAILFAICCSAAQAARIYTSGGGDGYRYAYSCWQYYDFSDPVHYTNEMLYTDTNTIKVSWNMIHYQPGYKDEREANVGVTIFSIAGLQGVNLAPGSVTLNVFGKFDSGNIISHSSADYGPAAILTYARDYSAFAFPLPHGFSDYYFSTKMAAEEWVSVDVTSLLQSDINAGHSYCAFVFGSDDGSYANGYMYAAESGKGAYLDLAGLPVPEPASIAALLCGLVGIAIKRRK